MRHKRIIRPLVAVVLLILLVVVLTSVPFSAKAISLSFSTVVNLATAIPAGSGNFTGFVPPDPIVPPDPFLPFGPGISEEGNVAFAGVGSGGQVGIYLQPSGPPSRVADLNTAIPSGTGMFTGFSATPNISGTEVAFVGYGAGGQQGVYRAAPEGPPDKVADLNTPIPAGVGNFTSFMPIAYIDGADVAFIGYGSGGQQGVYRAQPEGPPTRVADLNTPIPGGSGNFVALPPDPVRISNGAVVFIGLGTGGQAGVYLKASADFFINVADTNTSVPGGTGAFQSFSTVSYDGAWLAFVATGSEMEHGVYKTLPEGPPNRVADLNTAAPGGSGNFVDFGDVVVDPGVVVFEGKSDDGAGGARYGIYTDLGGTLSKIAATGDMLNGKIISALHLGPGGFSEAGVVFVAKFSDGTEAVQMATLCASVGFTGFHDPIGGADSTGGTFADPLRAFKLKSTAPVKMTLTDCDGQPLATGVHTIQVSKFSSATTMDAPIDATPTDAATSGNQFRLTDASTGEWHFNLSTKGLSKGIWQIKATLSDGSTHTAFIELK